MFSQLQGRPSHRYIALFVFVGVFFFLWHGFWPGSSSLFSRVRYVPSSYDWSKAKIFHPVTDMMSPPAGKPKTFPKVQTQNKAADANGVARAKKKEVKDAFIRSWEAYKTYAWGKDELLPISGKGKTSLSGWSAQLVDALDCLWIMDLKKEFRIAVQEVAVLDFSTIEGNTINLFEVTIRYFGGLIAAYDLSQEPAVLSKAIELGDTLYATFDTPNRLPSHWLDFEKAKKGETTADRLMSGAAGGSLCLEFTRLSQITGNPKYYDATERLKKFFYRFQNETMLPGLWPNHMNFRDETMGDNPQKFTLGAGADSQYEYLPKMDALLGGLDPQYTEMTIHSLETARDNLLFRPMSKDDANILATGDGTVGEGGKVTIAPWLQHLSCFLGGTYGLAGKLLSRNDFVDLGSRLSAGCVWAYDSFPTNIMPENSRLVACEKLDGPCPYDEGKFQGSNEPPGFATVNNGRYLLRPEAIESVFYMWRITGDQAWRDAAVRMWDGVVKETETKLAYGSVNDVRKVGSGTSDSMETFWMAETLKYFYLIFADESVISLDEWVLNTEAHPLRRPQ